jgi:hypothetical protein
MRLLLLLALLTLIPRAATGQVWPEPDAIGVYFDHGGSNNCSLQSPYTQITAYLLVTRLSEPSGLSSWECALVMQPESSFAGSAVALAHGGVNELAPPNYDVTLPAVLPREDIMLLATWSAFYLGGGINVAIGPSSPSHFPEAPGPGITAGDDPARRLRLQTPCALTLPSYPDLHWVAGVNGWACASVDGDPCSVPVAETTWGALKRLYGQ